MRRILFATVAHENQRYPTVGDYQEGHGVTLFTISDMHNDLYEELVAVHELVEYIIVKARGIPVEAIDKFDIEYEKARLQFDESEPGDHPDAPYRAAHQFATKVEQMLAAELDVEWDQYDKMVTAL